MGEVNFKHINVTLASTNVAQRVTTENVYASSVRIHNDGSNEAFVGSSEVDTSSVPIASGSTATIDASSGSGSHEGDYFNLRNVYIAGTAADVLRVRAIIRLPSE